MATKTAEKKSAVKKPGAAAPSQDPTEALAEEILLSHLHRAIVRLGEPARVGEIVREIGEETITPSLARHAMESHHRRFVAVDRRWDVTERYLDKQRPVVRTVEELVGLYGEPMPVDEVASELAHIYGRVREHFDEVAPRVLKGAAFFPVANGISYGLQAWLLNTDSTNEKDLLFYNYLTPETLAAFEDAAQGADWENDPVEASRRIIAAGNGFPVDNRVLQYFAWHTLGEEFDPVALYHALHGQSDTFLALPNHRWLLMEHMEPVRALWRAQAEEVEGLASEEAIAEPEEEVPAQPLQVTAADLAELKNYFEGREEIVTTAELLTNVFELKPSDPTFKSDQVTLADYLKTQPDSFTWVGLDAFRAPDTMPLYVGQVPESLTFPALPRFETADGEILDQMLTDAGFEETLANDILDPIAQDVNDQEAPEVTRWPENVSADSPWLRLALKAHHKEIGTFPLAQIPYGFFPTEPEVVELSLVDAGGNRYPIYVDYNVQLIYGLFDVYEGITVESGAVFHLEKTDNPREYKFAYSNESDAGVFVNPNRYAELTEFRSEIEEGATVSTYDIIRRILDHYRKGCSFLTLLTEVNLVRRTPRRLIASILSSYPAFHERATRWTFDPKKEPEGFDKRKTPFIIKK